MTVELIETIECSNCGESIPEDSAVETLFGDSVCEDCAANDYVACDDCECIIHSHQSITLASGNEICENCRNNGDYTQCTDCCDLVGMYDTTTVYDEYSVCDNCVDSYMWCGDCEYYVRDTDSDHCHDESGCECEASHQTFRIRNDGHGMLDNDTRTSVELPSGVISPQGMDAIARLIRESCFQFDLDTRNVYFNLAYHVGTGGMDANWQTKDGNFTKRLSRYAYKTHQLKLDSQVISAIGNTARMHSAGQDYSIEFTRHLNMSAEEFGHGESCYWQSYSESRCALKANGALGIRTFGGYSSVTGRAWIMPLSVNGDGFTPTTNTESPDAFIVFNGYGDLSGYAPARIMAHMAGMTYRKVTFQADLASSCTDSYMYVNGDVGYLVSSEDIATQHTDGSIRLSLDAC